MPQIDNEEWLQWAAYNLAVGIPETNVRAEMIENGVPSEVIDAFLLELPNKPEYRAAQQISRKLRLLCNLNDALLEMSSQLFDFSHIQRVSNLCPSSFLTYYYGVNRPVIIEDVVTKWPAMQKWNLDFLRTNFGNERVAFQSGRSAIDHRDSFVDHTVQASLAEFLDLIKQESWNSSPPYLIAHDRLLDKIAFKPLLDDLIFDTRYFDPTNAHGRVFFWLGPAGSATPMHRDLGNVYMAQIIGCKQIKMVPATQMHLIYNDGGYHSEADFDNLDFERFPLLKKAFIMEFTLKPGDLLFIPVGWWHFVKSEEITVTITGNNFCFPNQLRPFFD